MKTRLSKSRSAAPVVEELETRALLTTWQVLPDNYLDVGNEWQYATGQSGSTNTVTGTTTVAGVQCKTFRMVVGPSVVDSYQTLSATDAVVYGGQINTVNETVMNNDPMEILPKFISSTDSNRQYGHGQFTASVPGVASWTVTQNRKITYLGQENLKLTVNGHSQTFSTVKALVTHDESASTGSSFQTLHTLWFVPGLGIVKSITDTDGGSTTSTLTSYSGSLQPTGQDVPVTPAGTISVSGNGTAIASGDLTPAAADFTDFGTLCTDKKNLTSTFIVSNTGQGKLKLIGKPRVAITGDAAADFKVTAQSAASVSAAHSTKFKIKFDPTAAGLRTATVTILSDDPDAGSYTFKIQGTGRLPMAEIDLLGKRIAIANGSSAPSTANYTDFGSVLVKKGKSITRSFTITNTGDGPLLLTDPARIVITGTNASDFVLTGKPSTTISPGRSATFKIKFTPSSAGLKTALVSILSNDTALGDGVESPYTFAIQGTGTAI